MALNSAAYSREEIVKLYCSSEDPGDALYYSLFPKRFGPAGFLVTQAHTLDNILITNQISPDKVKWIKIDVEGAELEVLKGSTAILSKSNNISILVEIHRIDPEKTLYQPVVDFLLSYGFTIQDEWLHQGGEGHLIFRKG
jgi:FkbM family methyltransferase